MDDRIIDACCLLNFFATGRPKEIYRHLGRVHVSEQVRSEALWIREYDHETPPQLVPKSVDLTECLADGLIAICRLEHAREFELFVQFASRLEDGEASVLAIAKHRGWIVATDDKKARRIAAEQQVATVSTSQIVHSWTTAEKMEERLIGQLLKNVQQFSRFVPSRTDPLYDWWMRLLEAVGD